MYSRDITRLVVSLLEGSLAEVIYDARLAGLYSSLGSDSRGIEVTVHGYNDKLHLILDTVLQRLTDIQFKEDRLKVKKEEVSMIYRFRRTYLIYDSYSWNNSTGTTISDSHRTLLWIL